MGTTDSSLIHQYSIPVPNTASPGNSASYVHPQSRAYLRGFLPSKPLTLYENFKFAVSRYPDNAYLGTRYLKPDGTFGRYNWLTYNEVNLKVERIGWGLKLLGLADLDEDNHAFLGIYSKNRAEWVFCDLACVFQSIISIPIYDTLQSDALSHIVEQTSLKGIAGSEKSLENVFKMKSQGLLGSLQIVIQFEKVDEITKKKWADIDLKIYDLGYVENLARIGVDNPPRPESIYTISYTSGTTGKAKGSMMRHSNILATLAGIYLQGYVFSAQDLHLSYLPLAHVFERVAINILTSFGAAIGFYQGDVLKLREDLALLRPTVFISVPRLFNKFYDLISSQFSDLTGMKKSMVSKALASKREIYQRTGELTHSLWDPLVFNKVKSVLGGRVRLMFTGSAPISGEVVEFLRIVFACPLAEGYGQTENCGGCCVTVPHDTSVGIIGGPTQTNEIKLVDVPDMNYLTTDRDHLGRLAPRGEICIRGPTVFPGYYKNTEQTRECLDNEGWLHSGDIGIRLPHNGAFKVIDRKKNFFKLSQGEYVAAEKIEMVYNKSQFIAQIFVYGDSFQNFLIAIVVPDEAIIRKKWLKENGIDEKTTFEDICKSQKLNADILQDMGEKAKENKLMGFEFVKKIFLEHKLWTTDDLLTPTQKLMRFNAKKKYEKEIAELYSGST